MKLFLTLLLGFLTLFLTGVEAAQPNLSSAPTPTWIRQITGVPAKVDLDDISLGYYFELVDYQVNLSEKSIYNKSIKVIFEDSGIENTGQVSINFDPSYQKLVIHEIKVIREGKELNKLDISKFRLLANESELSRLIYNGNHTAYLIIDDLRKDDKLVIAYSTIGFNPVFENKFADSYTLESYEPVGLVHVNYLIPNSRKIKFKTFNKAPAEKTIKLGESTSYYWEHASKKTVSYSNFAPSWYDPNMYIECSEYASWAEVGEWAKRVNPIQEINLSTELGKFVESLWQESKRNKDLYTENAIDFVQNKIRYMGIEVGQHSHRAHAADKVFNQRYGDCKDKSVLLVSMLRAKGIDATTVLANTYQRSIVKNQLPSPYAFNHMVVALKRKGLYTYIDATSTNQGGKLESKYFPYYGELLNLAKPQELVDAEAAQHFKKVEIFDELKLLSNNKAILTVKTVNYGGQADQIRSYFKSNGKNQIKEEYESYYKNIYKAVKTKDKIRTEDNLADNVFTVYETYDLREVGHRDEVTNKVLIPSYSRSIFERLPAVDGDINNPVALDYPLQVMHSIKVVNPDEKKLSNYSAHDIVNGIDYSFLRNVYTHKDTLIVSYNFDIASPYIPTDRTKAYYNDYNKIINDAMQSFYVDDQGSLILTEGGLGNFNWILFCLLLIIGAIYYWWFIKKYLPSKPLARFAMNREASYDTIGGWLVFLGLALIVSLIVQVIIVFTPDSYLYTSFWNSAEYYDQNSKIAIRMIFVFETFFQLGALIVLPSIAYLFFQKRDLFPQSFFIVRTVLLVFVIVDLIASEILLPAELIDNEESSRMVGGIITSIIWLIYVARSQRVRGTFVVRSPAAEIEYQNSISVTENSENDGERIDNADNSEKEFKEL